jgi:hypothetical protein
LRLKQDPDFGPIILFGVGGVMTELIKDRAIGLPPLNRLPAGRMIEETKIFKLLEMIVQAAFSEGIKTVQGECLPENPWMINLAREFGAQVIPVAEGTRMRLTFNETSGQ